MEDKYQRVIVLDDAKLLAMIRDKAEFVEQGRTMSRMQTDLQAQMDKITQEMTSLTGKVIAHKRKIFQRIKKLAQKELTEYEIPLTADIRDGKPVLVVTNAMQEFQDTFKGFDKFTEPVPLPRRKLPANK